MRRAYQLALLAALFAFCDVPAPAQQPGRIAYPTTAQPIAEYRQPELRPLPPIEPEPVEPAGHWVFVPIETGASSPENIAPVPPNYRQQPSLPAPAVTDFAQVSASPAMTLRSDRLGPTVRIFEPKARVYFDTGWEAPDKLSLFHDGELSASINFLELYWQYQWPQTIGSLNLPLGDPDWRWGPALGVGISPQANVSSSGSPQSSGAPVLMLSTGLQFDFPLADSYNGNLDRIPTAGLEVGYALGVSSDESLDYIADGAIYVGVTIHVLP